MNKPVIICVDDEKIILSSLKSQLLHGLDGRYRIEIAESGEEALELIDDLTRRNISIPVILSDHIMPSMYGDELLRQVKIRLPETYTIMLTGQATADAVGNAVNKAGLYRYLAKPWQEEDLLLTVKSALEAYQQKQNLQRKKSFQATISHIIQLVINTRELDSQLTNTLSTLLRLDEFSVTGQAAIYLINKEATALDRHTIYPPGSTLPESIHISDKNALSTDLLAGAVLPLQELAGHLCYQIPLRFQHQLLGVLTISVPSGHQPDQALSELLTAIADTIASMIQMAQYNESLRQHNEELEAIVDRRTNALNDALRKQEQLNDILLDANKRLDFYATTDHLTGLYNRRCFFNKANEEVARALRYQHPTTLMMLDIDYFKQINDKFGHQAGDITLQQVARILQGLTRQHDIVGRVGGEEFAILTPENNQKNTVELAERIRQAIEKTEVCFNSHCIHISISIGITELAYEEHNIDKAISRADKALYHSKHQGRNMVSTSQPE